MPRPHRHLWMLPAAAAGLIGLPGCMVGPDFHPPETRTPAEWSVISPDPSTASPSLVTGEHADLSSWWSTLEDPQLTSLEQRAVLANLDLKQAESRVRQARASRDIAAAALLPAIGASAGYERSRRPVQTPSGVTGSTNDLFLVGLDASWEIDVFGGIRRSVEAAEADLQSAVEGERDVLVSLTAEVALNYAQLRGSQKQLSVARDNLTAQLHTLDITKRRVAGGLGTSLDVANAEAQVAATRSAIPVFETSIRQTIYALSTLLALDPTALQEELLTEQPIPVIPPTVPAGIPSDLLRRRPDIRRAESEVHAATARIGVATAGLFPTFSLTGALGFQSPTLQSLLDANSLSWSIGPGIQWALFDPSVRPTIELSKAQTQEALLFYQNTVLTALQDVQSALVAYAKEQDRREALVEAVSANQRATDMSIKLYQAGETDFLNVLNAQRSLLLTQDTLAQSTTALVINLVALYKALGGGWDAPDSQPAS